MPNFTYNGGGIISNIEVVIIFTKVNNNDWDDYIGMPIPYMCEIESFLSDIVDSAYMDLLGSEYSVSNGSRIGRGVVKSTHTLQLNLSGASTKNNIASADLETMIDTNIQNGVLPKPTLNTCYFVITVSGSVNWRGGKSGLDFGGYHEYFRLSSGQSVPYCFIDASGNSGNTFVMITHELAEVITDLDAYGWNDPGSKQEIADVCELQSFSFHGQYISTFWSNKKNMCVGPVEDNLKKPGPSANITGPGFCSGGIVEGAQAQFTIHCVRDGKPDVMLTYSWIVNGAVVNGPANGPSISVTPPSSPNQFQISFTGVDSLGCSIVKDAVFTSITPQQSAWQSKFCQLIKRLRREVIVNFHVDPLWDPLRDLVTHPVTKMEVKNLKKAVSSLTKLSNHLDKMKTPDIKKNKR